MRLNIKTLSDFSAIFLITYMFYKVFVDIITFGYLKATLVFFAMIGVVVFFCHRKSYFKDLLLLVSFITFSLYIFISAYGFNRTIFYRAVYEYVIYMMFIFVGAYVARFCVVEDLYLKVKYIGIILPLTSLFDYYFNRGNSSTYRAIGLARSEMAQGMLIGIYAIIIFGFYLKNKKRFLLFCTIVNLFAIVITGSRGPLVATVGGMLVFFVYFKCKNDTIRGVVKILIAGLIGFIILKWFFSSTIETGNSSIDYLISRMQNIVNWKSDAGNYTRTVRWQRWFEVFNNNKMFGIGPSKTGSWNMNISLGVTESGFIRHLVELGLVGSILYYFPIVMCMYLAIKAVLKRNANSDMIMLNIAIIVCVLIEDFVLQITEEITVAFFLWWALGMIYALSTEKSKFMNTKLVLEERKNNDNI